MLETALFSGKNSQLTKILHDRRSRRSRQIPSLCTHNYTLATYSIWRGFWFGISILYDMVQCRRRVLHCKWTPGRKVHSSHGWLNFLDFSAAARLEDLFQYFWIFERIIMKCLSLVPLVRCATLIYSLVLSLFTLSICSMATHVILHPRITLDRRIFKALKSPFW